MDPGIVLQGSAPTQPTNYLTIQNRPRRCVQCKRDHKRCARAAGTAACSRCTSRGWDCERIERNEVSEISTISLEQTPFTLAEVASDDIEARSDLVLSSNDSDSVASGESWKLNVQSPDPCWAVKCTVVEDLLNVSKATCEVFVDRLHAQPGSNMLREDLKIYFRDTKRLQRNIDKVLDRIRCLRRLRLTQTICANVVSMMPQIVNNQDGPSQTVNSILLACSANVKKPSRRLCHSNTSWPNARDYHTTERLINEFVHKEFGDCRMQGQLRTWFPAIHIAYLNRDHAAVRTLWQSRPSRNTTDLMGRKLAHLLVEGRDTRYRSEQSQTDRDWRFLSKLILNDHNAIPDTGPDARGMDLLSLVALSGDEDKFLLLQQKGACIRRGHSLLDFCLVGGHIGLTKRLVLSTRPLVPPPHFRSIQKAIELNNDELARCFLGFKYQSMDEQADSQWRHLAQLAWVHGSGRMIDLYRDLLPESDARPSQSDTRDDLQRASTHIEQSFPPIDLNAVTPRASPGRSTRTYAQVVQGQSSMLPARQTTLNHSINTAYHNSHHVSAQYPDSTYPPHLSAFGGIQLAQAQEWNYSQDMQNYYVPHDPMEDIAGP